MIEAELKADVHDPEHVIGALRGWSSEDRCIYRDTYYELPGRALDESGRELRVRTIEGESTRHVFTYKEAAVDAESQSKPEYETEIADRSVIDHVLTGIGLSVDIAFEKHCRNYRFARDGRAYLATVVQVPEVDDSVFIEVETMVQGADDVPAALDAIKGVFSALGIDPVHDVNGRYYQDMVSRHRGH